jgi:hypothetical protein
VQYCGNVNAKNSYGGYAGTRAYTSTITVEHGTTTNVTIDRIAEAPLVVIGTCQNQGLPLPS